MRTFEEYLAEGGSTKGATLFEKLIVAAYNGGTDEQLANLKLSRELYSEYEKPAVQIAKNIRAATGAKKSDMIHFGAGKGKTISWWTGDPTPKTDMYTTGGINISLKKYTTGSRLMTGLAQETKSTFRAVQEYMHGANAKNILELADMISPLIEKKLRVPGNVDALTAYVKTKVVPKKVTGRRGSKEITIDIDPNEFLRAAKLMQKTSDEFSELTENISSWFSSHPDVKVWFTYEAATGETKFRPDEKAHANWVVEFDPDSGNTRIEQTSFGYAKPTPYIHKLAKKVNVSTKFKSSSGKTIQKTGLSVPRSFSFNMEIPKPRKGETIFDDMQLAFMDFSNQTLNEAREYFSEDLLTEGIAQKVSDFFRVKVKDWLEKIVTWLVAKIKQVATYGYNSLLDYLGIEVDKVTVSGLEMFGF